MVLLEFSMSPLDKGESLSPYVARILSVIDNSGVDFRLTPMGTILEGEYEPVMNVVQQCFYELQKDCNRISVALKIDYRAGQDSRLQSKVQKIESLLNKQLSK